MEIECQFKIVNWNGAAKYTCYVTSATIAKPDTTITAFKGQHHSGKTNKNVNAIWFKDALVEFLPKGLSEIFPNLTHFDILNCQMKKITIEDLIGLEKLEVFLIRSNKLQSVPKNLFLNMPKLRVVSFCHNLLERFEPETVWPILDQLEFLNLKNNEGLDEVFYKKTPNRIEDFLRTVTRVVSGNENAKKADAFSKTFQNLFVSKKFSDFTIKVRGKEYKVHKSILAAQSSVFDRMFTIDTEEALESFGNIGEFSELAFEDFLQYFYIKEIQSEDNVTELFQLASEFDVLELKAECETIILRNFNHSNAREVYNLGHIHGSESLQREAFESIKRAHPEIGEYLYSEPGLVNSLIDAKRRFDNGN